LSVFLFRGFFFACLTCLGSAGCNYAGNYCRVDLDHRQGRAY
jgi:hypothetical protein